MRDALTSNIEGAVRMNRTLVAGAAILLAACATDPSGPRRSLEPPREFTVQEAAVANASVGFGLSLLREVADAENDPNLMVSPLSASMALGMLLNGASGESFDDMRATLGFGTMSEEDVNAAYKGLIAQLLARAPNSDFNLANSLWHDHQFQLSQSFVDALQQNFDAEVAGLDFTDPNAPKRINRWAEQETKGRIRDLIDQISPEEVLFLVNATYFKASWAAQFDRRSTHNAAFNTLAGGTVNVPMMSRDGAYRHTDTGEVVAVELPYVDSAFSMVVVAPKSGTSLAPVYAQLEPAAWASLMDRMRSGRIMLGLPKFRLQYNTRLDPALKDIGMAIIFDGRRADLSRIADGSAAGNLYVTRVQQNTFLNVDETGSEAAAATAVGVGLTSAPPSIVFNRPFVFAIRERTSGTILFIGRVGDPRLGGGRENP